MILIKDRHKCSILAVSSEIFWGNMILIKDRHYKQWASLFDGSYGKYDTYKGSTPLIFSIFFIFFSSWEL